MGADIHMVLQKKNEKTGEFETVLYDVLPGRDYALFTFLSGVRGYVGEFDNIANPDLPDDFYTTQVNSTGNPGTYHNDFYMGEHSYGHIGLKEFCEANTPKFEDLKKFEIDQHSDGYTVTFLTEEDIYDDYAGIRALQKSLKEFFGVVYNMYEYRLVFGYDS